MSTAELHHNWGTALDRLGRRREACAHFRAALSIEGDNPDTLFNLGLSLEALGEEDEALDCYRRAVAARPTHAAAERLATLETDPR
jgi:tetratricopeptide (TPR) repeat protein